MKRPMDRAALAAKRFHPHPNPRVGAVIVDANGDLIASAGHEGPGNPHAEVSVIAMAGELPSDCALYVTLEPCDHTGRTGPCTEAIKSAGIRKVVIGAIDPDEKVAGRGIAALEAAGIDVTLLSSREYERVDPGYFHHRRTGRPRFTLKAALTMDGQMAAADGTSQWISGEAARRDGHCLRAESDAVLVGAGTVLADDPRLDARLCGYESADASQPRPIVLAGRRPLPRAAQVMTRSPIVIGPEGFDHGSEAVVISCGSDGLPDPVAVARYLGAEGLIDVLIEGGPSIADSFWRAGLVDRGVFYLAARIAGGLGLGVFSGSFATLEDSRKVSIVDVGRVGDDVRVEFVTEDSCSQE